jgi:dTDP-alpha-D-glucuronic acid decarboxylase
VPRARGQVFNIGSAAETSIGDLASQVVAGVGSRSPVRRTSYRAVYGSGFEDIPRRVPDIRHARRVLGWAPEVPLDEGLKRTIAWWGGSDD